MEKRYLYKVEDQSFNGITVAAQNQTQALGIAIEVLGLSDKQEKLSVKYQGEVYV